MAELNWTLVTIAGHVVLTPEKLERQCKVALNTTCVTLLIPDIHWCAILFSVSASVSG